MVYYKTNKRRGHIPVAAGSVYCGLEQCRGDFGPWPRGKGGLSSGVILGFSFSRPFFLKKYSFVNN